MRPWTRIISKKVNATINFANILNPTYWPLVGDKAKQFHVGDQVQLSIPSNFGPAHDGGDMPSNIVDLKDKKNGTTGKIISIDEVQGIPGSDASAMTIMLDDGERLENFPAAWVLKITE